MRRGIGHGEDNRARLNEVDMCTDDMDAHCVTNDIDSREEK
jgi:hypothetical protein